MKWIEFYALGLKSIRKISWHIFCRLKIYVSTLLCFSLFFFFFTLIYDDMLLGLKRLVKYKFFLECIHHIVCICAQSLWNCATFLCSLLLIYFLRGFCFSGRFIAFWRWVLPFLGCWRFVEGRLATHSSPVVFFFNWFSLFFSSNVFNYFCFRKSY